jgi:hypothetical protein
MKRFMSPLPIVRFGRHPKREWAQSKRGQSAYRELMRARAWGPGFCGGGGGAFTGQVA